MKTNIELEKQLEIEKDCLKFIKSWFKGIITLSGILWTISILLLTKLHIDYLLIPTILFTAGISLSSIYMLFQANKSKYNIKKILQKINTQQINNDLISKQHTKENKNTKINTNNKDYSYKPNKFYNNQNININTLKNYKVKRRVLKNSNIHTTKKSD